MTRAIRMRIKALAEQYIPRLIAGAISTEEIHRAIDAYILQLQEQEGQQEECIAVLSGGSDYRNLRSQPVIPENNDGNVIGQVPRFTEGEFTQIKILGASFTQYVQERDGRFNRLNLSYRYWYLVDTPVGTGWVIADAVEKQSPCDIFAAPIDFIDATVTSSVLDGVLPSPPQVEVGCTDSENDNTDSETNRRETEAGRLQCAAQVYINWYNSFGDRAPTVRDLLELLFQVELAGSNIDIDTRRGTIVNQYLDACRDGCTGEELVNWLSNYQGWYQMGRTQVNDVEVPPLTSTAATLFDNDNEDLQYVPGAGHDHGNYNYTSQVYRDVMSGVLSVIACEVIREAKGNQQLPDGKYVVREWKDYISVIVNISPGTTETPGFLTDEAGITRPEWARREFDSPPLPDASRIYRCLSSCDSNCNPIPESEGQ